WRSVHMRDNVAALEQRENGAHWRDRLANVDHHGQIKRCGCLLRTAQSLKIVGAGDVLRQPRLDPDNDIAIASHGPTHQGYVGAVDVHQLAAGEAGARRDVDQSPADLRPSSQDSSDFVDVVGSTRSGIDQTRYSVLQSQRGRILATTGVSVDVDQP